MTEDKITIVQLAEVIAIEMIAAQTKALLNFTHKHNFIADRKYVLDSIYKEYAGIWPYSIRDIPFEALNFSAS